MSIARVIRLRSGRIDFDSDRIVPLLQEPVALNQEPVAERGSRGSRLRWRSAHAGWRRTAVASEGRELPDDQYMGDGGRPPIYR